MITFSGIHCQKIGGIAGTPTAIDIAVQTGRITRYAGAIWMPVLTHQIFVGLMAFIRSGSIANLAGGFIHDSAEIITGEIPRPFKCDCMRREQDAIDARLYDRFLIKLPDRWPIDWKLIKQCDIDACHIEAMYFGLPNFEEKEVNFARDYSGRDSLYADPADRDLFDRLVAHTRFYYHTIDALKSPGVMQFGHAIQYMEDGEWMNLANLIRRWELIPDDRWPEMME